MDQEMVNAAELVAEFKGLRDGRGHQVGFSVRWHGPNRQWIIDLRPHFTGTGKPDGLRTLAEAVLLGALDRREFVTEPVMVTCLLVATDRYQVQATIGPDPGGAAYFLEVKVATPAEEGGQHVLGIIGGGRFGALDRAQLETAATDLLAAGNRPGRG
jgi:hypothetical protein